MKTLRIALQALAVIAISTSSAQARIDWTAQAAHVVEAAGLRDDAAQAALGLVRMAMIEASRHSRNGANGANGSSVPDHHAAAAYVAAYAVLECLFPKWRPGLEGALAVDLADFPETDEKAAALAHGRRIATQLLHATPCGRDPDAY